VTAIRSYRSTDRDSVAEICVLTGAAGKDSREMFPDHRLLPTIFAEPYTHLEPELAFVVDNGERAVGYIIGTADTSAFVHAYRHEWLPLVTDRYPAPTTPAATPAEEMVHLLHDPERMVLPELAAYPAHLHMNLLPDYQRKGLGRELVNALVSALRQAGVPGLHLTMLSANVNARAFYDRVGFREIQVSGNEGVVTYLGMRIDA
jgi:ribosomal protein S18 acetylase RimI-like enzyme